MIIRKEDLRDSAIDLGLWSSLCDLAGVKTDGDDIEIEITAAHQSN